MITPTFKQTKFLLAAFLLLVATAMAGLSLVMVWRGKAPFMDATLWWAIGLTIFSAYSASDVVSTHLQQSKNIPPQDQTA